MTGLDQLLPAARLVELDHAELAAPPAQVWELIRHGDLARAALVRALFALGTVPDRLAGRVPEAAGIHIDDLRSAPAHPGFAVLAEVAGREVTVGAIGKVWQLDIPFVHVPDATAFARFAEPGFVRVGERDSRVEIEVRVDATSLAAGPVLLEPIGFAMDRRMLLGVKARAEASVPKAA